MPTTSLVFAEFMKDRDKMIVQTEPLDINGQPLEDEPEEMYLYMKSDPVKEDE